MIVTFNTCTQKKFYIGSSAAELDKQQLIIELQQKELAMKTREISLLEQKIADQQKIINFLETKSG